MSTTDATAALAQRAGTTVVEEAPERAVVVQGDEPALSNHVGVRHASALYLAALEASRRLALATAREQRHDASVELAESDIRYGAVPTGTIVCTAVRSADPPRPGAVDVHVVAESDGREVAALSARWTVGPGAGEPA